MGYYDKFREIKSDGHISFAGDFEYYDYNGEVYRAPLDNVIDLDRNVRFGRWECARTLWNHSRNNDGSYKN
jgi:hypothetical protein|tara:strand:+ start:171 stop:383 length:213 start_codon:yes stop_codon:yes gene_type:complete